VQHFIEIFLKTLNQGGSIKDLLNMVNPMNNERKNSIKQRTTHNKIKSTVLVIASLAFFTTGLVFTPISLHPVFAAPPHPCFNGDQSYNCNCENNPAKLQATCCWDDPITGMAGCQVCQVNTDTGEYENCREVLSKGKPDTSTIAPPPSGVAPPPSTTTCPANTVLDTNGNCAPLTQAPTDQGTTAQPPTDDNTNNPKHHKGDELSQLPPLTGDNKNNNDNKPSKHHKGGDTLTSPLSSSTDQGTQ
jgi:hypothetical protein